MSQSSKDTDLIHGITENRLRHAGGPVQTNTSDTYIQAYYLSKQISTKVWEIIKFIFIFLGCSNSAHSCKEFSRQCVSCQFGPGRPAAHSHLSAIEGNSYKLLIQICLPLKVIHTNRLCIRSFLFDQCPNECRIEYMKQTLGVVYFDQRLGAAHSKTCIKNCVKNVKTENFDLRLECSAPERLSKYTKIGLA